MKKLKNEYLRMAIDSSLSNLGIVSSSYVKAYLVGFIIGKKGRELTQRELEFIHNL
jgi:hypothetical protein